jgi:hypothetical protein
MESLYNLFQIKYPDFEKHLKSLPKSLSKRTLVKLQKGSNIETFTSLLAEVDFGLLFNRLGFQLEYEKKYSGKEPDWTLSIGNSKAICEVYRLGKSKNDQKLSDFQSELIEKVRLLEFDYFVKFGYLNNEVDLSNVDSNKIVSDLNEWLHSSPKKIGDRIEIINNFYFEVTHINAKKNKLSCRGSFRTIELKPGKLIQHGLIKDPNKITKKISKYNEIISQTGYPYFLCIALDFACGFEFDDFEEYFLGKGVGFDCEEDSEHETSIEDREYGTEWTELGVFYKNPQLSGLIILDNNKYHLLLNPLKNQIIYNDTNKQILNNLLTLTIK